MKYKITYKKMKLVTSECVTVDGTPQHFTTTHCGAAKH